MESDKKRILFVDDNPKVLNGLKRMLHPMRHEWEMEFAVDADSAIAMMEHSPFDVMVTDMRMPGKNGVALLEEVMSKYPQTIRFVLSGHSDMEMSLKTAGMAHQFLAKPSDADTIRNTVARAFALRDVIRSGEVRRVIAQINSLPALPAIYTELINEIQSPDSSMTRAGAIIEKDVAISAKILQLVNSAFFGLCQNISSPAQAASLLGLEIIKALILGMHVFQDAGVSAEQTAFLDALWLHSIGAGKYAQEIVMSQLNDRSLGEQAFMAGMLHDLGKLIILSRLPEKHEEITNLVQRNALRREDAEKEVLSATHAEIGAYLLGIWGFPDHILEAVAFHHEPGACLAKGFSIVTAVHVGNVMEHETGGNTGQPLLVDAEYLEKNNLMDRLSIWRERCHAVCDFQNQRANQPTA